MPVKLLSENTVPAEAGVIFARPAYERWADILESNRAAFRGDADRQKSRAELVDAAVNYSRNVPGVSDIGDVDRIVVTGHQPVWHHCGVAAKGFAAGDLARRTGGVAIWLVLDHDICDTAMIVPREDGLDWVEIGSEPEDVPVELRSAPSDEQVRSFVNRIKEASAGSLVPDFDKLRLEHYKSMADFVTGFQAVAYKAAGIRMIYLPVSVMSRSGSFFDFAAGIIKRYAVFAAVYNEAVDGRRNKAGGDRRILRPLKIEDASNSVELPFWVITGEGRRYSVYAGRKKKGQIGIGANNEEIGTLSLGSTKDMAGELEVTLACFGYKLRPKAVTLTLFARLYLADIFVHGIGGQNYEYVTDALLERFYNMKKTVYGVATGTMRFGGCGALPGGFEDAEPLRRLVRQMRCNPEDFISQQRLCEPVVQSLVGQKRAAVEQANESEKAPKQRKCAWEAVSHINNELSNYCGDVERDLLWRIEQSEKYQRKNDVLNYREFFFGLFGEEKLREFFHG